MNVKILGSSILFLILVVNIIPASVIPDSFASKQIVDSVRGADYSDISYADGTHVWTGGLTPWVKTHNGTFAPYVLTSNSTHLIIDSMQAPVTMKKSDCTLSIFDNSKLISDGAAVKINQHYVSIETNQGNAGWVEEDVTSIACTYTTTTNSTGLYLTIQRNQENWGNFTTVYSFPVKGQTEFASWFQNQNPNWMTDTKIDFIVNNKDMPVSGLQINSTKITDLSSVPTEQASQTTLASSGDLSQSTSLSLQSNKMIQSSQTVSSNSTNATNWIFPKEAIKSDAVNILTTNSNVFSFDQSKVKSDIQNIIVDSSQSGSINMKIQYGNNANVTTLGNTIFQDPIYGYTNAVNWRLFSTSTVGVACGTGASIASSIYETETPSSGVNNFCMVSAERWDISSIPLGSTVTSASLNYDIGSVSNPKNCDYTRLTAYDPSVATAANVWTAITSPSATYVSNDAGCTTVSSGNILNLGPTAVSDATSQVSLGWFAVGWKFNDMSRDGSQHDIFESGAHTNFGLQLVYHKSPPAPTLTAVNQISATSLNITWTNTTSAHWFLENRTSPAGGTLVNILNTTALFHLDTGLSQGTQYQYGIQAGNSTGLSVVSNKIARYTVNIAPTALTFTNITPTSLRLNWTPPSGNSSSYKIEYEHPVGGGWSVYVADTGNTTSRYDITGLSSANQYNFRVSTIYAKGSSDQGTSSPSTPNSSYTTVIPPSGLAISQSVVNDLHLTWSNSLNSSLVSGYKIERSIDFGVTYIVLVPNTGTTALTYDDTTVITGDTYTYRVSTVTPGGTSVPTSPVSATVLSAIQLNPTEGSGIQSYNTTALNFGFSSKSRGATTFDVFPDYSSSYNATTGKQSMSWYRGANGSPTLSLQLADGTGTLNLVCSLSNTYGTQLASNGSKIYYECPNGSVNYIDMLTGLNHHVFTAQDPGGVDGRTLFLSQHHVFSLQSDSSTIANYILSWEGGNTTLGYSVGTNLASDQKLYSSALSGIRFNQNTTSVLTQNTNPCEINFSPTNTTTAIDAIACDQSLPAMSVRFWQGMMIQKVGNYATNNMQLFLSAIDVNPYKKLLSLPCSILGLDSTSCTTFIITDPSINRDYFVAITSTTVYYEQATTALSKLTAHNYALQSYSVVPYTETSSFNVPSPLTQPVKLYGPSLNVTLSQTGLETLPSGYTMKGTSLEANVRNVDPRWTNDNTDIPLLTTTSSLFPIFLTVNNAPVNAALMVTLPSATINSISGVWTVTLLDATHSAEFDIPSNQCGLIYIANIQNTPSIWTFEGQVCATGVNQKTIAYTDTLPLNFWNLPNSATDSFTPATNALTTTFHTTTPGTTYSVLIKNANGTTAQSYSFTVPLNATLDTQHYNVSNVVKPAGLYIYSGSNLIYSTFLGSSVSLAGVASFFNTYLSYQGFSLLAFIPIVFASMFTRNTVGIGVVLTVLCIATLSWLSIVVIPEMDIYIMILIAIIGLIAYRIYYG